MIGMIVIIINIIFLNRLHWGTETKNPEDVLLNIGSK